MSKNIVSGLAYNQGSEFMSVLQKAGLGTNEAQAVITGRTLSLADQVVCCIRRGGLEAPLSVDEERASEILGRQRVISCYEGSETLNVPWPEFDQLPVFFSEKLLLQAAEANLRGLGDWYLIFCHGFTTKELVERRIVGVPYGHLGSYEFPDKTESGYHLINLKPKLLGVSWHDLQKLCELQGIVRAEETVLVETLHLLKRTRRKHYFIGHSHWSKIKVPYTKPHVWTVENSIHSITEFKSKSPNECCADLGIIEEWPVDCPGSILERKEITVSGSDKTKWFAAIRSEKELSQGWGNPDAAIDDILQRQKVMGHPYRRRDYKIKVG